MNVVKLNTQVILTGSDPVKQVSAGDTGLKYAGGGTGGARSREADGFDEDEDF